MLRLCRGMSLSLCIAIGAYVCRATLHSLPFRCIMEA